jgi:predicted amidohydrolase YtcJ
MGSLAVSQPSLSFFPMRFQQALIDAMRPWWNAGFNVHVHANGSGGNQITLDVLQALQDEKPRFNHRFAFEHFGISTVAQGRQVKALGAVSSTNPYYVYERADLNAPHRCVVRQHACAL